MFFASCENESDPKSDACDIVLFSVNGRTWNISGTDITYSFPADSTEGLRTPTINVSPGATVNPPSGQAQNFFVKDGVKYTITAEDGVSKKDYTVKAVRTQYSTCEILSFVVNDVEWEIINDSLITHKYLENTQENMFTPSIILSPGATVDPPSNRAQNFFSEDGVTYTVTSEDKATTKTYIAKAKKVYSSCEILSFSAGGAEWNIDDTFITCTFSIASPQLYTPVITLSPGAKINPPASMPQNFFTEQGVTYTVTSEDEISTKTYTVKAILQISGVTGSCTWSISSDKSTLTISGNGTMSDYDGENPKPWEQYKNNITTIIVDEGVTHIGKNAFRGAPEFDEYINLTSATISNSVKTVGYAAFAYCDKLISVTIGNSVETIDEFVFYACHSLVSVTVPNSVKTIGKAAFDYCYGLTSVEIGNSVTYIGEYAFFECSRLTSVTIPSSVTTIAGQAFGLCTGLLEVTNLSPTPQNIVDAHVFNNVGTGNITLRVPPESVSLYQEAAEWKEFGHIINI
jgi:hypothetical protein